MKDKIQSLNLRIINNLNKQSFSTRSIKPGVSNSQSKSTVNQNNWSGAFSFHRFFTKHCKSKLSASFDWFKQTNVNSNQMHSLYWLNRTMRIQTKSRNNLQSAVEFKSFWERAHKNPNSWLNAKERSPDPSWAKIN